MPSIEIICIGQKSPSTFRALSFPILSGTRLKSHRYPSLFQGDFSQLRGCIYHLGGPSYKGRRGGFFEAYELLSPWCRTQKQIVILEFGRKYVPSVRRVLNSLLRKSLTGEIIFTSDYQFSSNRPRRFKRMSITRFWSLYRSRNIRFNALYKISDHADGR